MLHYCYIWSTLDLAIGCLIQHVNTALDRCCLLCAMSGIASCDLGLWTTCVSLCVDDRALHDLGRDGDFEAYGYYGRCEDTPCQSLNPSQQNALSGG